MFKLFHPFFVSDSLIEEQKAVMPQPTVTTPQKTINEIIEEIHDTFYTEVDRLLDSAKIDNSLETDKQELLDKCERLTALGFASTKEVKEAQKEITRIGDLRRDNQEKRKLIRAINHFSFKYPHYKFITEDSVKKICQKYNLVYGEIDRYIGTVPDANIKHMEDFKISETDECFVYKTISAYSLVGVDDQYVTNLKFEELEKEGIGINYQTAYYTSCNKCPLEIVAPVKDFDMRGKKVSDYNISKIEIPDPIVLKPVLFERMKYYLIVTAWGLEASDELVVNERNN